MNLRVPRAEKAQQARSDVRSHGTIPAGSLDIMIEKSWKRCQALGLAEDRRPGFDPLPRSRMQEAIESNHSLIAHARPVMETLYSQIVDTQSMLVLTDAHGLILHSLGDDDFLQRAEKVALKPGVVWSEEAMGTNAIGTAIAEDSPALVHGPEHFLAVNQFLTCSAIPISDPYGKLAGVLDLSGDWRGYHRHTMALVRMSGLLIENHMFGSAFAEAAVLTFHSCPEFIGTLCEGMIAFRPDGSVLSANKSGLFQLGLGLNGLRSHTFFSLFGQPVSALFDHVRSRGSDLMQLSLPAGIKVFARARIAAASGGSSGRVIMPAQELPRGASFPGNVTPTPRQAPPVSTPGAASGTSHGKSGSLDALKTGDPQIDAALHKVHKVLGRDISVLIQGETGTGKELVARAIHHDSPRRNGPFVAVNCASIPETLIESELFGYEEGAFTGARRKGSVGKIMLANSGTLFLDEIGDMPLNLQARLLRVLQERVVTPLGSSKTFPVDVAIICATHRRLKDLIARGQFREDLYYRLNGLSITLPPLRMRQDLHVVVQRILREELKVGDELDVSAEVLQLFCRHPWPGNVRQLANVLRTAVVMADGETAIRREHLPDDFLEDMEATLVAAAAAPSAGGAAAPAAAAPLLPEGKLEDIELNAIQSMLDQTGGNVSATARRLGISRNTIYRKLRQFGGAN
ncbi:MAG: sigma-54-dependent Fis family transcriptional regulator [Rhodocyclaceae bacterium]|nr:sigma-54-dependent Fis family transcriptional regulator [Rhodocyclaceae bacterium]